MKEAPRQSATLHAGTSLIITKSEMGKPGSAILKTFATYHESCDSLNEQLQSGSLLKEQIFRIAHPSQPGEDILFVPGTGASTELTVTMSNWDRVLIQSVTGKSFIPYTAEKTVIGTDEVQIAAMNDAIEKLVVP